MVGINLLQPRHSNEYLPLFTVPGYHAHPVKGASSAFAIIYAITIVLSVFSNRCVENDHTQYIMCTYKINSKYKAWYLFWLLPCTSIIFTAGFICREYNAFHPSAFAPSQGLLYSGA
jgi:hypothetical protein